MGVFSMILGGARSGKSRFAEALASGSGRPCVYVATAQPLDGEMAERIAHHRARRPAGWITVEEPLDLAGAITAQGSDGRVILVDCLTLWLSNLMHAGLGPAAETDRLLAALAASGAPALLVSNEVGFGLVPETPLGRAFRDEQGRLNQRLAAEAAAAVLVVAGLPLWLKGDAGRALGDTMPAVAR